MGNREHRVRFLRKETGELCIHLLWLDTISKLQHERWSLSREYCYSWVGGRNGDWSLGSGIRQLEFEEVRSREEGLKEKEPQKSV